MKIKWPWTKEKHYDPPVISVKHDGDWENSHAVLKQFVGVNVEGLLSAGWTPIILANLIREVTEMRFEAEKLQMLEARRLELVEKSTVIPNIMGGKVKVR